MWRRTTYYSSTQNYTMDMDLVAVATDGEARVCCCGVWCCRCCCCCIWHCCCSSSTWCGGWKAAAAKEELCPPTPTEPAADCDCAVVSHSLGSLSETGRYVYYIAFMRKECVKSKKRAIWGGFGIRLDRIAQVNTLGAHRPRFEVASLLTLAFRHLHLLGHGATIVVFLLRNLIYI